MSAFHPLLPLRILPPMLANEERLHDRIRDRQHRERRLKVVYRAILRPQESQQNDGDHIHDKQIEGGEPRQ